MTLSDTSSRPKLPIDSSGSKIVKMYATYRVEDTIQAKYMGYKPLTAASLFDDEKFADGTIVIGDRTLKVHRWVLCTQSKYFEKAFESKFVEGNEKIIDLTENSFNDNAIENIIKFLYTMDDKGFSGQDALDVYEVADYFMVAPLRHRALFCVQANLERFACNKFWEAYGNLAMRIVDEFPFGEVQDILVQVTAKNIGSVMYDNPYKIWDQLKNAQPSLTQEILASCFPRHDDKPFEIKAPSEEDWLRTRAIVLDNVVASDDVAAKGLPSRGSIPALVPAGQITSSDAQHTDKQEADDQEPDNEGTDDQGNDDQGSDSEASNETVQRSAPN